MMSAGMRRQEAEEAAKYAKANGYVPVTVTAAIKRGALRQWREGNRPGFTVPFIGDYVPEGYTPTNTVLFVDTSGFGDDRSELALTTEQFLEQIRPGYAYAIIEAGQFQAYIQEYTEGGAQMQKAWPMDHPD